MENKQNQEKGITIVALIITIIILLLLITIAIGTAKEGATAQNSAKNKTNKYNSTMMEQLEDLDGMNIN